jgi:homoserine acetyltransferase
VQIAQWEFKLRHQKLAAHVGRNVGGIDALQLAILAPAAAVAMGMG